jgi:hypothetical protein
VDPYAVLALLGFLVFLFYIIYNFLNRTGTGKRNFPATTWWPAGGTGNDSVPVTGVDSHSDGQSQLLVFSALDKFSNFNWESFLALPHDDAVAALSNKKSAAAF